MEIIADQLPRFMQCNGSHVLFGPSSSDSNPIREEGIAAHYMALAVFSGQFGDTTELIDRKAPNGVYMTPEMSEHVDNYLTEIQKLAPDSAPFGQMEIETSGAGTGWVIKGRSDHISLSGDTLRVRDFKYGYSISEPEDNWTLIWHALGWCFKFAQRPSWFEFIIHQPRAYHPAGPVRVARMSYNELMQRYQELNLSLSHPRDELRTGPNCRNCTALERCTAATMACYNAIEATDVVFSDKVGNEGLSLMIDTFERAGKIIEQKTTALKEMAKDRIKNGQPVGDYHLEPSYGNRAWDKETSPAMMQAITGIDLSKPGLITPAQAIKKGVSEDLVNMFAKRPSTGIKLVRENAAKRAKRLLGEV